MSPESIKLDLGALDPQAPLKRDDPRYVPRPTSGADRLVRRIKAGADQRRPIAIAGPAGSGKSTEVAAASSALGWWTLLLPIDRIIDLRTVTETLSGFFAASLAAELQRHSDLLTSIELEPHMRALRTAGFLEGSRVLPQTTIAPSKGVPQGIDLADILRSMIRSAASRFPFALFLDGLEKTSAPVALAAVNWLRTVIDRGRLIVVVPPSLVTGPGSYEIVESFDIFPIRAVHVQAHFGSAAELGRAFFCDILGRRWGVALENIGLRELAIDAAVASGGVPRTFLQLVQDSFTAARLRGREMATLEDLVEAKAERAAAMTRLLREGDVDALRRAEGSNGLEVDIERKLRFLAHGLLLEYDCDGDCVVHAHPLLARTLGPP